MLNSQIYKSLVYESFSQSRSIKNICWSVIIPTDPFYCACLKSSMLYIAATAVVEGLRLISSSAASISTLPSRNMDSTSVNSK